MKFSANENVDLGELNCFHREKQSLDQHNLARLGAVEFKMTQITHGRAELHPPRLLLQNGDRFVSVAALDRGDDFARIGFFKNEPERRFGIFLERFEIGRVKVFVGQTRTVYCLRNCGARECGATHAMREMSILSPDRIAAAIAALPTNLGLSSPSIVNWIER